MVFPPASRQFSSPALTLINPDELTPETNQKPQRSRKSLHRLQKQQQRLQRISLECAQSHESPSIKLFLSGCQTMQRSRAASAETRTRFSFFILQLVCRAMPDRGRLDAIANILSRPYRFEFRGSARLSNGFIRLLLHRLPMPCGPSAETACSQHPRFRKQSRSTHQPRSELIHCHARPTAQSVQPRTDSRTH